MSTHSATVVRRSGILRIRGVYRTLKSAERRLADFVLNNPEVTIDSTVEELERRSNSSYATIYRFCRKLGFGGFRDFKSSLISDLMRYKNVADILGRFHVEENSTPEEICQIIYEFSSSTLEETVAVLDSSEVDEAAKRILNADHVYFIGAGTSGVSARYAYTKFFRIGISCSSESDATICKMQSSTLEKTEVLFAISSSGRTRSIVDAAQIAHDRGAVVVSLSDYAISPLAQIADIKLFTTPRNVGLFLDVEMPLIVGQVAIIDILFTICMLRKAQEATTLYQKTKTTADTEKIGK